MAPWGGNLLRSTNLGGVVVAAFGFFLTRFTVTFAMYEDPVRFFLVGLVPLLLGLAVALFGVVLAVGAFEPEYARTVAIWTLVGSGTMAVLVALTLYGVEPDRPLRLGAVRSKTYLSNFLIGGCFGGMLTGVYAARNRRERVEQRTQAKRMVVLNRVLRDQVLNSIVAIRGHLDMIRAAEDEADRDRAIEVVRDNSSTLEETVEEIKHLTKTSRSSVDRGRSVDVAQCVRQSAAEARERFPEAEIVVGDLPAALEVQADEMLEHVLELLIENAVEHNDSERPRVEIAVRRDGPTARLTVVDDGPGLPVEQQQVLDHGTVADFDDPLSGFGLNVVSLLVESYRGRVESHVLDTGTRIDVQLPVADGESRRPGVDAPAVSSLGASRAEIGVGAVAAVLAGFVMGVVVNALAGVVPVIGALYVDEANMVVGWITHEFHSVVFGVVFVGLLSVLRAPYATTHWGRITVGVAWGLYLWVVAAGFVMPVWLRLVGTPAPVPNLQVGSLLGHLVWGAVLGGLYSVGSTTVTHRLPAEIPSLSLR